MDTAMAFIVGVSMTVTGQAATDSGHQANQPSPAAYSQHASNRTASTSKRIELTNNWLRNLRHTHIDKQ